MQSVVFASLLVVAAAHDGWLPSSRSVTFALDRECLAQASLTSQRRLHEESDHLKIEALRVISRQPNNSTGYRSMHAHRDARALFRKQIVADIHLDVLRKLTRNVSQALDLERRGRVEEVTKLIFADGNVDSQRKASAIRSLAEKYGAAHPGQLYPDENIPTPVATDSDILTYLDIIVIYNPFLSTADIQHIVRQAPCIVGDVELEHYKPYSLQRRLQGCSAASSVTAMSKEDVMSGFRPTQWVRVEIPKDNGATTILQNSEYRFQLPNDPLIPYQWWLFGSAQGHEFGIAAPDAWAYTALSKRDGAGGNDITWDEFAKIHTGINVAVIDGGCSRHDDLVDKYYRRSGCS
eukprot:Gregarina_sp_Poly_1__3029@NODE_184_length_11778_cov_104_566988_g164_i0_p4_GENE_NODE_184_length_11778_cov_104_566988_g164_i0NODE_184_length_11778_cov_104_566988_g164_i0_p4_ORF_typecomplete_len350_score31_04_NODE_184_length_11778_cov_104_566988_g164_i071648213